jgi:lipoprotein-anchoring transpeptidase ErfK/SrfK
LLSTDRHEIVRNRSLFLSNVLTGWTQGGPIAIHGTDKPWSIGRAASNVCSRVRNSTLRRILAVALPGTPVVVRR